MKNYLNVLKLNLKLIVKIVLGVGIFAQLSTSVFITDPVLRELRAIGGYFLLAILLWVLREDENAAQIRNKNTRGESNGAEKVNS